MAKLTQYQLERKLGKLITVLDSLRKEAHQGDLPGHVRIQIARATDALAVATAEIRSLTLTSPRTTLADLPPTENIGSNMQRRPSTTLDDIDPVK